MINCGVKMHSISMQLGFIQTWGYKIERMDGIEMRWGSGHAPPPPAIKKIGPF